MLNLKLFGSERKLNFGEKYDKETVLMKTPVINLIKSYRSSPREKSSSLLGLLAKIKV